MGSLRLKGIVVSGKGGGARFVGLPWAKRQIEELLGFAVFFGTLNIRLTGESIEGRKMLLKSVGMEVLPAPGHCRGRLFRARLKNTECAVVVPLVAGYPQDLIEIVASANLRDKLHLVDGSSVEVEVRL